VPASIAKVLGDLPEQRRLAGAGRAEEEDRAPPILRQLVAQVPALAPLDPAAGDVAWPGLQPPREQ
jgi:hypothetical protein